MKKGEIVVIDAAPSVTIHARLKHPLVSGWTVEIICKKGIEFMRNSGHPAYSGYTIWVHNNKIGYEYESSRKDFEPCDDGCVFEEEMELYKTYGGD